MRISFDLDGVLADMDSALAKIAEREFGITRAPARVSPAAAAAVPAASGAAGNAAPAPDGGVVAGKGPGGTSGRAAAGTAPASQDRPPGAAPGDDPSAAPGARSGAPGTPAGPGAAGTPPAHGTPGAPGIPGAPTLPLDLPTAAILSQLTSRQQSQLWARVRETPNFWETLAEHEPGMVRRIQHLAYELRWEVLFVTQRPSTAGRTAQVQSQRWLHRQGFDLPAVYTTRGSRGLIASALTIDAHVDDRLENAIDVATESRAWSILVWRDEASLKWIAANAKKFRIAVVPTVAEALARIEAADRGTGNGAPSDGDEARHTGDALLARLKKTFGMG